MRANADCSCDPCVAANGTNVDVSCDDGDSCTVGDTCSNGVCSGENTCLDLCAGVQCSPKDCYNVTCMVDTSTNSPFCANIPLMEGSACGEGKCVNSECVVPSVGKKREKYRE
jgi:hypothetical protein